MSNERSRDRQGFLRAVKKAIFGGGGTAINVPAPSPVSASLTAEKPSGVVEKQLELTPFQQLEALLEQTSGSSDPYRLRVAEVRKIDYPGSSRGNGNLSLVVEQTANQRETGIIEVRVFIDKNSGSRKENERIGNYLIRPDLEEGIIRLSTQKPYVIATLPSVVSASWGIFFLPQPRGAFSSDQVWTCTRRLPQHSVWQTDQEKVQKNAILRIMDLLKTPPITR